MGNSSNSQSQQPQLNQQPNSPNNTTSKNKLNKKQNLKKDSNSSYLDKSNSNKQKLREPNTSLLKKSSKSINSIDSKTQQRQNSIEKQKQSEKITKQKSIEKQKQKQKQKPKQQPSKNSPQLQQKQVKNSNTPSLDFLSNQQINYLDSKSFYQNLHKLLSSSNVSIPLALIELQSSISKSIQLCKSKFRNKLTKKQIYVIFSSDIQQQSKQNKLYQKDLLVYQIALKNRFYKACLTQNNLSFSNQVDVFKHLAQMIEDLGNAIIAELMGKTTIWRSLMINFEQQKIKIIQMLAKQGINNKTLDQII